MEQPKLERMLRLMKLMTANVNYTINDLADRLDTSYRSIYRYIDTFKEAGFVVQKLDGGVYKLGKQSRYFKEISQLVHFTDEEAHIVNQLIEALDDTNALKQNLRKKLTTVYNCTSMASSIVRGRNASNVNRILDAIERRCQVLLVDYASSHTGVVRNRIVEPFGFTTNYVQAWCYEPESGMNKLFKISRIGSVELLDIEWQHEAQHAEGYIDIFRMTGFEQRRVQLRLGMLARNLLIEEYPLAERDIKRLDSHHWLLDTKVCNYLGIGRFVVGLLDDVEIIDSPELKEYIRKYLSQIVDKVSN
jgi:predicted DNA-binding transcriptional regulator YafY